MRDNDTDDSSGNAPSQTALYAFNARRRLIGGALIAVLALAGAIYAMTMSEGNRGQDVACAATTPRMVTVTELAHGEVAGLVVPSAANALPTLAFTDADAKPLTLADFKGKVVLLNLWATWCAPCRHEMPALDRLQAQLGSEHFEVVAVNVDTGGAGKATAFLEEIGVGSLAFYADHSMQIFRDLREAGKAFGMPTTVLIDEAGCEMGTLNGPAEWDSPDAQALIRAALDQS